ncbi:MULTISPECIES: WYL domain-containing protein [Mycobacterium]|uniref:Transcriptional regulator n=1 Tax=Mycobacterium colombiense TaxID=339268 RepID=A0A329M4Y6_9MYCO|nr:MULTISPECIES: WYL domain-containing protein [Mycobacterium]MDM4140419.1 WYL domain-containing protein [Mycobacterium sp. FLAC0960]RAV14924.1 transcriptional regulator [Mycobacterium colombiense]
MTKTERWYAIVEELRASSPRPRSARWLAERFEVSTRTIERDLDGLLQAGVPLYTQAGRSGGWILDSHATFAAPSLDAAEVTALAVAVAGLADTPFAEAGKGALSKIVGSLGEAGRRDIGACSTPVGLMNCHSEVNSVPRAVQWALRHRRVLRVEYGDTNGAVSVREVEPVGFLGGQSWYLVAWCRLREEMRTFRMDRIRSAEVSAEPMPQRDVDLALAARGYEVEFLNPLGNSDSTVSQHC